MKYRCHQCFAIIDFEQIAHVDMYSDVCWIQCDACAALWGQKCGVERAVNPHPHGYFACPYRPGRRRAPRLTEHPRMLELLPADGP